MNHIIFPRLRIRLLRFFARRIVTPFTPFVLSDAWLSSEIKKYELQGLNAESIDLSEARELPAKSNPVFFVQADQLEFFRDFVLTRISAPFSLITGKWHLPALTIDNVASEILANPSLTVWYSQNAPEMAKIRPFPYGVELSSAPMIWVAARFRFIFGFRRRGVFVPWARVHSHLEPKVRETRMRIAEASRQTRLSLPRYFLAILRHRYVISPAGDRPDTYRHWETVALGAVPISELPQHWRELFGNHMVFVKNLTEALAHTPPKAAFRPGTHLVSVKYWRGILQGREKQSRALPMV